jgi:predicted amidophosphoribosyltransferase
VWTPLVAAARDLLLAETCAVCGGAQPQHGLCRVCQRLVEPAVAGVRPLHPPPGFPPTWAAAEYTTVVRRAVVTHKEEGRLGLAVPLGNLLAAAVLEAMASTRADGGRTLLVPIPSRRRVTRTRGHDPVRRMAQVAARLLRTERIVRVRRLLAHQRAVVDQSGLDLQQRHRNLSGAFTVRSVFGEPECRAGTIVLVDDVCSSGATLAAAAVALVDDGWRPADITAAVVAAPPVRSGPWPATGHASPGLA